MRMANLRLDLSPLRSAGQAYNVGQKRREIMRVFISHSNEDKLRVEEITSYLQKEGIDVFIDHDEIKPGDSIIEKISSILNTADAMVLFLSKSSIKSEWTKWELSTAISKGLKIIPVLLDREVEIPFFLKNILYIDYTKTKDPQSISNILLSSISSKRDTNFIDNRYEAEKDFIINEKLRLELQNKEYEIQSKQRNQKIFILTTVCSVTAIAISVLFAYLTFTKSNDSRWAGGIVGFFLGYLVAGFIGYLQYKRKDLLNSIDQNNKNHHREVQDGRK